MTFRGSSAAYGALEEKHINSKSKVYIDSGCTKTVFCNLKKLTNTRKPDGEYIIKGVGGNIRVTRMGDFPMALKHKDGTVHVKVIKDCLYAPDAFANLLSVKDLSDAGRGFEVPAGGGSANLIIRQKDESMLVFPLQQNKGLYQLPFYQDTMTHFAGAFSHQLRALTQAELWHLRLGHAGARKIAKLSQHCKGIPKPIPEHDFPCHTCQEGKAQRQDYPAPSEN